MNALIGGCLIACALLGSGSAAAIGDAARQLQQQWDVTKYQTAKPAREKALEKLAAEAKIAQQKSANDAEVLVWEAIILSTYVYRFQRVYIKKFFISAILKRQARTQYTAGESTGKTLSCFTGCVSLRINGVRPKF